MNKNIFTKSKLLNKSVSYLNTNNSISNFMGYTMTMNMMNFKLRQAISSVSDKNIRTFKINSGSKMIPHYKKKETGGEDSFLVFEDLIMVADGVGGWAGKGVDPGLFSRELRDHVKEEYDKRRNYNIDEMEIKSSLVEAVKKTKSKGSSTIAMLLLNQNTKKLIATYVGDSLYMILRYSDTKDQFELFYKSSEQQHKFNQPFQVGTNGDSPNLAIIESHDIRDKDIIIVASDGLWDNIYDDMIISIINQKVKYLDGMINDCEETADFLAQLAEKYSRDINYESPFAKRAKSKGYQYYGGKEDDITIVISQIKQISENDNSLKKVESEDMY